MWLEKSHTIRSIIDNVLSVQFLSNHSAFLLYISNVNKTDNVVYFSTIIYQLLLVCFKVCMSKISDKKDKFLLSYNNNFGVHFYQDTAYTANHW